jgi:hypothetical protein
VGFLPAASSCCLLPNYRHSGSNPEVPVSFSVTSLRAVGTNAGKLLIIPVSRELGATQGKLRPDLIALDILRGMLSFFRGLDRNVPDALPGFAFQLAFHIYKKRKNRLFLVALNHRNRHLAAILPRNCQCRKQKRKFSRIQGHLVGSYRSFPCVTPYSVGIAPAPSSYTLARSCCAREQAGHHRQVGDQSTPRDPYPLLTFKIR